jgi:hypothetical protein
MTEIISGAQTQTVHIFFILSSKSSVWQVEIDLTLVHHVESHIQEVPETGDVDGKTLDYTTQERITYHVPYV